MRDAVLIVYGFIAGFIFSDLWTTIQLSREKMRILKERQEILKQKDGE